MYVFVLDEKGIRQTSYVVGIHADTLEETEQLAKQTNISNCCYRNR